MTGSAGRRLRYVALGDSYTIGTSVAEVERWPNQLTDRLDRLGGARLELVANLAVDGFTSADVVRDELPQLADLRSAFLSLLVGVNDVVQGVPLERYRANLGRILDVAVPIVGESRILLVSTPDYTVTPRGSDFGDPTARSAALAQHNAVLEAMATERGIAFVDVFDVSLRAATDRALVARDGLHPSGAQYARWVDRIVPVVVGLLARPARVGQPSTR